MPEDLDVLPHTVDRLDSLYAHTTRGPWRVGSKVARHLYHGHGNTDVPGTLDRAADSAWCAEMHEAWPAISAELGALPYIAAAAACQADLLAVCERLLAKLGEDGCDAVTLYADGSIHHQLIMAVARAKGGV